MTRQTKLYLALAVVMIVPVVFVGCHGGGAVVPESVITDQLLRDAVGVGVTLTPQASAPDSDCTAALLALFADPPDTRLEVETALQNWIVRATANPEQAACQLGLCLLMLARGLDNVATDLGYDVFEELDGVDPGSVMALAMSENPGGLVGAYKRLFSQAQTGAGTAGVIPGVDFTSEDVEDAIRAHLLPVIYNQDGGVYQRLAPFGDSGSPDALVTLGIPGGDLYTLYACDFNMMAASMQGLRGFLLEAMAYEWAPGLWDPPDDYNEWDTNADGMLSPNEYLPPAPFGTLHGYGALYMADALDAYRDAVERAIVAADTIPDDPTDLLNMFFSGNLALATSEEPTPLDVFKLILAHFDALLDGVQTLVLQYWNEGDETPQEMNFRVDITQAYVNPVNDIRSLLPTVPLTDLEYIIAVSTQNGDGVGLDWNLFPDLTFNGILPDLPATIATISGYDFIALNHADQIWGPIPLNPDLRGGEDFFDYLLGYIIVVLPVL